MRSEPIRFAMPGLLALAAVLVAAPGAAQGTLPDAPVAAEVVPPAGARGETVEIALSGQRLSGATQLICRYSAQPALLPPQPRGLSGRVTGSTEGQVKAVIAIDADAPPGVHEIRVCTAQGITNPVYFHVSQHPLTPEREPNQHRGEAQPVQAPATLSGVIGTPNDRDSYRFSARVGQTLTFEVEGFRRRSRAQNQQEGFVYLDSCLSLEDSSGNEIAFDDDSARLDSFLAHRFESDGEYVVTIRDTLYRGRGDFRYLLTISQSPIITAVFPPGGPRGERLVATVYGYNLNSQGATSISQAIQLSDRPGAQEFRLRTPAGISNGVAILSTAGYEQPEVEPNNRVQDATQTIFPVTCSGKFDTPDDVDAFRFTAQGGQRVVIEVEARSLGSPADTAITLMSWTGRLVDGGRNDDRAAGNPDSRLEVTIPSTEDYVLFIRNQARTGAGPQYFYRVSIRAPRPLFTSALRQEGVNRDGRPVMVPVDNIAVTLGGSVEFELELSRREGQKGDVEVFLDLPPGTRGLKLEEVDREPPKPDGRGGMTPEKVTVRPKAVVKDGKNNVLLRLTAAEEAGAGCRLDLGLRLMGVAGAQPYEIVQPLWLTISPKS